MWSKHAGAEILPGSGAHVLATGEFPCRESGLLLGVILGFQLFHPMLTLVPNSASLNDAGQLCLFPLPSLHLSPCQ